jgi:glyoxylase-like metal-dependent hydrolase (beta-lactamase superfamily II)
MGLFSCAAKRTESGGTLSDGAPIRDSGFSVHGITTGSARVYLLETDSGCVLVDAGYAGYEKKIMRVMKKLGRDDLRIIFLTHAHFDHFGSAGALRRITGAKIAIHRADSADLAEGTTRLVHTRTWGRLGKPLLPLAEKVWPPEKTAADIVLENGDRLPGIGIDMRLLHTPGHTPGSSCLIVEDSVAFVGDLISAQPWARVQQFYASDWEQIEQSLKRLQKLAPSRVYCGHGTRVFTREELLEMKAK